jgi:hypothetical protein
LSPIYHQRNIPTGGKFQCQKQLFFDYPYIILFINSLEQN